MGLAAAMHKSSDALNLSKVLAGGMAAALSAVFGSYFGAFGTVGGAAVGSVATTIVTRMFQKSIERTQTTVVTKVKNVVGSDGTSTEDRGTVFTGTAMGAQPTPARKSLDDVATVRMSPEQAEAAKKQSRRSTKILVGGTVMIFLMALALVTGIEWAKGSPIFYPKERGQISLGTFHPAHQTPVQAPPPSETDSSSSDQSSDDNSSSEDPSEDDSDKHQHHHSSDSDSDSESNSDSNSAPDSGDSDRDNSGSTETDRSSSSSGGLLGGLSGGHGGESVGHGGESAGSRHEDGLLNGDNN